MSVLTASGTATVQTAIHGKPMVVLYKLSPITYRLGRGLAQVDMYAMVNLIAGRRIVRELIQDDCTPEAVAEEAALAPLGSAEARHDDPRSRGGERRTRRAGSQRACGRRNPRPAPRDGPVSRGCRHRLRYTHGMRAIVIACVIAAGLPLSALTVKPLSFPELVAESGAVVHGRVAEVRGQWTTDRRGIESLVTVDAIDYLKGHWGGQVTVRVPGGQVGTFINLIPGAPRLAEGDRVVLFVKASGPSIPVITGTSQGVYRVAMDAQSGTAMVVPPIVEAGAPLTPRGDLARRPLSLPAFADAVRRAEAAR